MPNFGKTSTHTCSRIRYDASCNGLSQLAKASKHLLCARPQRLCLHTERSRADKYKAAVHTLTAAVLTCSVVHGRPFRKAVSSASSASILPTQSLRIIENCLPPLRHQNRMVEKYARRVVPKALIE